MYADSLCPRLAVKVNTWTRQLSFPFIHLRVVEEIQVRLGNNSY